MTSLTVETCTCKTDTQVIFWIFWLLHLTGLDWEHDMLIYIYMFIITRNRNHPNKGTIAKHIKVSLLYVTLGCWLDKTSHLKAPPWLLDLFWPLLCLLLSSVSCFYLGGLPCLSQFTLKTLYYLPWGTTTCYLDRLVVLLPIRHMALGRRPTQLQREGQMYRRRFSNGEAGERNVGLDNFIIAQRVSRSNGQQREQSW